MELEKSMLLLKKLMEKRKLLRKRLQKEKLPLEKLVQRNKFNNKNTMSNFTHCVFVLQIKQIT